MSLPPDIALMHPTPVVRPFHREGWVYEEKYDGWRILAYKADGKVRLLSRNGRDHARRFSEVAMFDQALISRFEWLRHRTRDALATPPIYMAFDAIQVGSRDLHSEPLHARRKMLESLVGGQRLLLPARRLAGSGLEAWAEVERRGYEGLVARGTLGRLALPATVMTASLPRRGRPPTSRVLLAH